MRKSFVALLLSVGAASLAKLAFADASGTTEEFPAKLMNAHMAQELRSRAMRLGTSSHDPSPNDTTFVGYNPAYAGSNYWSVGVGFRHPRGAFGSSKDSIPAVPDANTGYWDWDHPVHGDSLQGWWPIRHPYSRITPTATTPTDDTRPWHAIDIGNQISYTINQGSAFKRTFGVTSAWHRDNAGAPVTTKSDVNPVAPSWSPLVGNFSAWCGLRCHGDEAFVDAVTGNPYNVDALREVTNNQPTAIIVAAGGTDAKFPGYAGQWDQMLYRDIDISNTTNFPSATLVSVGFTYQTAMSTARGTSPTSETGWFDKDPLEVATPDNFISASAAGVNGPIDSFMVYVGNPVGDAAGDDWLGSDGLTHDVFDPVRRWFGELIRANAPGGHYELFSAAGDNSETDVIATRNVSWGTLRSSWGNKVRLVFRVKTNRSFRLGAPSDDGEGSRGGYSSGGMGAAQIDTVRVLTGVTTVHLGGFENAGDIDNSTGVSALNAWKTSSKPPAIYHHVHDLSSPLLYEDLCGRPGSVARICDLAGNVISMGDHDLSEAFAGPTGTAEQERHEGIISPTINLAYNPSSPTSKNNMGLDADSAVPETDFGLQWNIYTGGFDLFTYGSGYQHYFQSYPAEQSDGVRMWGEPRFSRFQNFNPDKQCYEQVEFAGEFGQVFTTNAQNQPDSVRIGFRKITQCYLFGTEADCGTSLGGYWDNASLVILDGEPVPPISNLIWELWNDTFPFNETVGLPGTAGFDTTTAMIKGALQSATQTGDDTRYVVAPDTIQVDASGDSVELQLKFRILPGPGNYLTIGDKCSGLVRNPAGSGGGRVRITSGDGTFWSEYIDNPGKDKDPFPASSCPGTPRFDQRWSELVWCNARCDTAEINLFAMDDRGINSPLPAGTWATMYHEEDKHLAALGISRHKCFLVDTAGPVDNTNITCSSVPAWVSLPGKGYNGVATTTEYTKILPDGLLTPGSHVEYFFMAKDLTLPGNPVALSPDTSLVFPQNTEGSLDAHRWQQFGVLPDLWKAPSACGLGRATMLYVDWNDRRGNERVWVSIADSIGATSAAKSGNHNGWSAPSSVKPLPGGLVDINDPKYHVDKNGQPGTTWDMYGVKASESLTNSAATIGSRLGYNGPGTLLTDKGAKNAPTVEMLEAYYRIIMILTGDLNSTIIGPNPSGYPDRTSRDTEVLKEYLLGASSPGNHRGLFIEGDGFVEATNSDGNSELLNLMGVALRNNDYFHFSGNPNPCPDLIPQSMITTNGDIYGVRNTCLFTLDVLKTVGTGQAASLYDPVGGNPLNAPYISGVFQDTVAGGNSWQSLVDGWNIFNLRNKQCDKSHGRLAYFWNVFTNVFGKICAVAGSGPQTTEVPNNDNGKVFVDFAGIGNNPLRQGSAVVHLTLAKADRVTVKIYDVSGRLVRTLSDGQMFKAGKVDPALTWDGLDNNGRQVARGAYFVSIKYLNSRYENSRKMIVLK